MNITEMFGVRTTPETDNTTQNGNQDMNGMTATGGCEGPGRLPQDMPIGMLYVPYQKWERIYDPQVALARGTIFEALDKPFIGERTV